MIAIHESRKFRAVYAEGWDGPRLTARSRLLGTQPVRVSAPLASCPAGRTSPGTADPACTDVLGNAALYGAFAFCALELSATCARCCSIGLARRDSMCEVAFWLISARASRPRYLNTFWRFLRVTERNCPLSDTFNRSSSEREE